MNDPVMVTGANGFIGAALCDALQRRGTGVVRATRTASQPGERPVGDITADTDWAPLLEGVAHVVHTAARVHVGNERGPEADRRYHAVNVEATRRLTEQAAAAGVKRLVFLSTVKVNGEATGSHAETAFTPFDTPAPADAYARSKWAAEQALHQVAADSGMAVTIIRPPLVYGPGVGGNFARLIALVRKGLPLPLAAVDNRRSLLALDNLTDLIIRCIDHPAAAGETFLVSDDRDFSTPGLIAALAKAMGRPARLVSVPPRALRTAAAAAGRGGQIARLLDSLRVDISHTRDTLDWAPAAAPGDVIARTVHHAPRTARRPGDRAIES